MPTPLPQCQAVRLFTASEVRTLDDLAIKASNQPGIRLMRRAGQSVFGVLQDTWPQVRSISIYCGKGNNAGDGYIVAGLAASRGYQVEILRADTSDPIGDTARARLWCLEQGVRETAVSSALPSGDLIVDALLGTGSKGCPRPAFLAAIEQINAADKPIVAVDLPSGLDANSGVVPAVAVNATITVTFIGVKRGLVTGQGPNHTGTVYFDTLEVPDEVYRAGPEGVPWLQWGDFLNPLSPRQRTAHKGVFGHALLVGGAPGLGGAALLAAEAALRAGVGLLSLATAPEHVVASLARRPEVMVHACTGFSSLAPLLERADVIACGPGLGTGAWAEQMLEAVLGAHRPLILDADALNLLARWGNYPVPAEPLVVTPHPGEAARLLGIDIKDVEADRYEAAARLARTLHAWVILKGAGSILAAPDGTLLGVCGHGNPGLATGGTGDVLTGLILGLWPQVGTAHQAIQLAVCAHGLAADQLVHTHGEIGMLAGDMPPAIRRILNASSSLAIK